jgi:hypothetical protein
MPEFAARSELAHSRGQSEESLPSATPEWMIGA